jgi:hypothetical protein
VSRRPALALAAMLSATLLSGCGVGLHNRTYQEHGREDGAVADLAGGSGLAIRNLHLVPPATGSILGLGSSAVVVGGLVNKGTQDDKLVGATSDVAGGVTLLLDGSPVTDVVVPALGAADQTWSLQLNGLTRSVAAAQYVGVTLEFARAGRVTLQVPLFAGQNGLADRTPEQNPYGEK